MPRKGAESKGIGKGQGLVIIKVCVCVCGRIGGWCAMYGVDVSTM